MSGQQPSPTGRSSCGRRDGATGPAAFRPCPWPLGYGRAVAEPWRYALLPRLGISPSARQVVREFLEVGIAAREATQVGRGGPIDPAGGPSDGRVPVIDGPPSISALDAGCGRVSALKPFRPRIGRLVGVDIHTPDPEILRRFDEFALVDVCAESDAFPEAAFDVILSSFTVEHLADARSAFKNFRRWLRPGGRLVLVTVNRRHPFVGAYLGLPSSLRSRFQRLIKASGADAHPLIGSCNDVERLRGALEEAGYSSIQTRTVGHLARAWGIRSITWALGLVGDVLAQPFPSRRSTIVIAADA